MAKVRANRATNKRAARTYPLERLKPHHAKSFRKRHYGLLIVSIVSLISLVCALASSSLASHRAIQSAKDLIARALDLDRADVSNSRSTISSSYGFSMEYDPSLLTASGLDSSDSKFYIGSELATPRQFTAIKIASNPLASPAEAAASGSIAIGYHTDSPVGSSADLAKLEAQFVGANNPNFSVTKSSTPQISGQPFLKSEWGSKGATGVGSNLQAKLTSYTGVVNNVPLTIVINSGLAKSDNLEKAFADVVNSLQFNTPADPISNNVQTTNPATARSSAMDLLDKLTLTSQASASSLVQPSSAERTSMLYGPAVVKIYNTYCMDISLGSKPFISNSCNGATGSGFFVGNDGYIATNGHVAVNSPLDIAIIYAFDQASKGNPVYFSELAAASGLTQADLDVGTTNQEQLKISVEKFYQISETTLSATNKTENIIIGLGEKQPDIQTLLSMTKAGQAYPEEDTLKQAGLVGYDYRAVDGADTGSFRASDVALLKIEGGDYPSTEIGSISSLTQGSGLSIIGYPAAAGSNQLVEAAESRATLTSGKVSSIKSATGSSSQLIETDATIGHGNSGGPAFNDSGEVVGIATYTIDGSGNGNGVYSYIRDIADLSSLASRNSVDIYSVGQVQQSWQKGIEQFYQAHYTKALKEFKSVKELYPQHPKVDQLSALAKQKIDAGEEIKDSNLLLVIIAITISLFLLIISVLLIVQHMRKHKAYQEHIQSQPAATQDAGTEIPSAPQNQEPPTPTPPLDNQQ